MKKIIAGGLAISMLLTMLLAGCSSASIEETEPTIEIQTTSAAAENTTEPANSATEETTVLATEAATEPPATEAPTGTVPEPTEVVTMPPAETELEELLTEEQQNSILHQ